MKTNLVGRKVRITETVNAEIVRQYEGKIVAVGYYNNDIKFYHRGFDLLVLTECGKILRASTESATILETTKQTQ